MKKLLLAFVLMIGVSSFNNTAEAQNINVNINIGNQPSWGPVGYDYVGYYYFPDIDCYYDVNTGMYYFYERGRWVSARYLPYTYSNYDLYGLYKVVLNVNNPWTYNSIHRRDYARYAGYKNQRIIRDSRDQRYSRSRQNNVVWYSGSSSRPANNNVSRPNSNSGSSTRPSNNGNSSTTRPTNSNNTVSRPSSNSGSSTRSTSSSNDRNRSTSNSSSTRGSR